MIYKTKSGLHVDLDDVYVIKSTDDGTAFFTHLNQHLKCDASDQNDFLEIIDFGNNQGGFYWWAKKSWSCNVSSLIGFNPVSFDTDTGLHEACLYFHQNREGVSVSGITPSRLEVLHEMFYKSRFQEPSLQDKLGQKGTRSCIAKPIRRQKTPTP